MCVCVWLRDRKDGGGGGVRSGEGMLDRETGKRGGGKARKKYWSSMYCRAVLGRYDLGGGGGGVEREGEPTKPDRRPIKPKLDMLPTAARKVW